MIYPHTTFSGQKVSICNRYIRLFQDEHNEHPDGVSIRTLRAELDTLIPVKYHGQRLIYLATIWGSILSETPEIERVMVDTKFKEALRVVKKFGKWQRDHHNITIRRLFNERHLASQETRLDNTHSPTLASFSISGGKHKMNMPSKNPNVNEATNLAFAERFLHLHPDAPDEYIEATNDAIMDAKQQAYDSDFWDIELDLESVRLNSTMPEPPDPLENYTSYVEADAGGHFTVTSSNIDVTALPRNVNSWVVDDKESAHFNEDFEHLVDTEVNTSQTNALFIPWMLANKVDDWNGVLSDAGEDFMSLMHVSSFIRIHEGIGTSLLQDQFPGAFNTPYYHKLKRAEAIGAHGLFNDFIYSDTDRTSLLDTLSITLRAKNDFQYIYGLNSGNNGSSVVITGSAGNLDLQEVTFPAFMPVRSRLINSGGTLGGLTKSTLNNLGGI